MSRCSERLLVFATRCVASRGWTCRCFGCIRDRCAGCGNGWRGFAILWLNACVLFLAANLAALLVLALRERPARMTHPFDPKLLRRFFPTLGDQELADFVRENVQTFQYEPFTQFRERPAAGRYVNVHPAGFRVSRDQGRPRRRTSTSSSSAARRPSGTACRTT